MQKLFVGRSDEKVIFGKMIFLHCISWCVIYRDTIISNTHRLGRFSPNLIFQCLIFLQSDFPASHFSMRVIYCYPISLHKSSHCRISSRRIELVRDIIFQCRIGKADHRQLNVFTLTLLMLDCRYLTIFCQRCDTLSFQLKALMLYSLSPDLSNTVCLNTYRVDARASAVWWTRGLYSKCFVGRYISFSPRLFISGQYPKQRIL